MITNGLFPFQKQFNFHLQVTMICQLNESAKFLSGCVFNLLRKKFVMDLHLLTANSVPCEICFLAFLNLLPL